MLTLFLMKATSGTSFEYEEQSSKTCMGPELQYMQDVRTKQQKQNVDHHAVAQECGVTCQGFLRRAHVWGMLVQDFERHNRYDVFSR